MSDITNVIISIIGSTALCIPLGIWVGSILNRSRYKVEIDKLRAELAEKLSSVKSTELDNVRKANDLLVESIVTPLKKEISSLRRDVEKFRKAVEKIPSCPHAADCPVSRQLRGYEGNDDSTNADK